MKILAKCGNCEKNETLTIPNTQASTLPLEKGGLFWWKCPQCGEFSNFEFIEKIE